MIILQWALGLVIAAAGGHFATRYFLDRLRKEMNIGDKPIFEEDSEWRRVTPWVTGVVERIFFAVAIAINLSGTVGAMVGWLALKLATNWNHPDWKTEPKARSFAFSALLGGLVSMLFAVIGGVVCSL